MDTNRAMMARASARAVSRYRFAVARAAAAADNNQATFTAAAATMMIVFWRRLRQNRSLRAKSAVKKKHIVTQMRSAQTLAGMFAVGALWRALASIEKPQKRSSASNQICTANSHAYARARNEATAKNMQQKRRLAATILIDCRVRALVTARNARALPFSPALLDFERALDNAGVDHAARVV